MATIDPPHSTARSEPAAIPYLYSPLRGTSLRILCLDPGTGDEPLRGKLQPHLFKDLPRYKAVSYVWGPPVFPEVLYLDTGILKITSSLAEALRRFRDSASPTALWADQICINQDDLDERAQQVTIMGAIYGRSKEVLIWLGAESALDIHNFWLLHLIANRQEEIVEQGLQRIAGRQEERIEQDTMEDFVAWLRDVFGAKKDSMCACCHRSCPQQSQTLEGGLDLLESFWRRDWFKRLWVVQELQFGRRSTFYCGSHNISGESLRSTIEGPYGVRLNRSEFRWITSSWVGTRILVYFLKAPLIRRLLMLILMTVDLRCSEPRDRVYAIAAMCSLSDDYHFAQLTDPTVPNELSWPPSFIQADYQKPAEQLWLEIATLYFNSIPSWKRKNVLDKENDLDVHPGVLLALRGTDPEAVTSWSWVPDISKLGHASYKKSIYYAIQSKRFLAGGLKTVDAAPVMDTTKLRFQGKKISRINAVQQGSQFPEYTIAFMQSRIGHMMFKTQRLFPWYWRCRGFMEAHRAVLDSKTVREILHLGLDDKHVSDTRFDEVWDLWWPPGIEEEVSLALEELKGLVSVTNVDKYDNYDLRQVLALMSDGKFAWVPETTQPEDAVVILQSCPFPFILRPSEPGHYMIVGDAYVEGIMHGEAWMDESIEFEEILIV